MGWASESMAEIRMVLTGARTVVAGMAAARESVAGLREEVAAFGLTAESTGKRSWLMNQALFTMRRYAYMGTLAFTGLAAVAVKWGYDFNSAMQSATTALLPVMHGTGAVRTELEKLFNIAKYSPFQFKDLTIAFRSMYLAMQPLGISAATVTTTIQSLIDALSATGRTSPMQLNRVAVALQHMAYQGRLTGFTVNQLARDGIPIFGALSKEMGITGDQLHNISKLGIPAQAVLDAINKYIETTPGYMNAAYRQAQTLHGQLTTLRDNISQTMGALTLGSFNKTTTGVLPAINKMFDNISKIIVRQKGRISIAQVFGVVGTSFPWMRPIIQIFNELIQVVRILWNVLKNALLPTLVVMGYIFEYAIAPWLNIILGGLKFLSKYSWALVPVLTLLIGLWAANRAVIMAVYVADKLLIGTEIVLDVLMGRGKGLMVAYTLARLKGTRILDLYRIASGKAARNELGQFRALTYSEKAARALFKTIQTRLIPAIGELSAAVWAFLTTNPVGWIILIIAAIILLVTGLVILYFKWKWFHNLVNTTFHWIWEHWKLMAIILAFIMPPLAILLVTVRLLYDHWALFGKLMMWLWNSILRPIYNWLKNIWNDLVGYLAKQWNDILGIVRSISNWFNGIYNWLLKVIKKFKEMLGLWKKIPGATWFVGVVKGAAGAISGAASDVWHTPGIGVPADQPHGGALPTAQSAIAAATASPFAKNPAIAATIHVHTHIDGKKVAESVSKTRLKHKARS